MGIIRRLPILLIGYFFVGCNQQPKHDYVTLYRQAEVALNQKHYMEAVKLLDEVIALQPDFDSAYVERAYGYLMQGKTEEALRDANKSVKMQAIHVPGYYVRGLIHTTNEDYGLALNDFAKVIRFGEPIHQKAALQECAFIYWEQQDYGQCKAQYDQMISIDPLDASVYVNRGIVHLYLDVTEEYNDLLNEAKHNQSIRSQIIKYYSNRFNRIDGPITNKLAALRDFTTAIALDSTYSEAYYQRATVYSEVDEDVRAMHDLNKAIALEERSEFYNARAGLFKSQGNIEQALTDYNRAIELDPSNGIAYANRGYLKREKMQDERGAREDLKRAKELGVRD